VNDDGEYESASEEGVEEKAHGDEDLTGYKFEQGATPEVTEILSVQEKEAENGSDTIYFKLEHRCMIKW